MYRPLRRSEDGSDSGRQRFLVRTIGRFQTLEEVEGLIVARRGDAIVRLSDVASVRLHHSELRQHSLTRGQPALTLSVRREPGSNVIAIKNGLLPAMEELNSGLLARNGLELRLIADDVFCGLSNSSSAFVVEAARDDVHARIRPILISTLTTVFGLLPLVLIPGAGTELYRGLGVVVLAGLLCSMVVTLVFLPSLLVAVLSRFRARGVLAAA